MNAIEWASDAMRDFARRLVEFCEYCYANANKATAHANYRRACAAGMFGATITGG